MLQNMVERLSELLKESMWRVPENMEKELQKIYLNVEGLLEDAGKKK